MDWDWKILAARVEHLRSAHGSPLKSCSLFIIQHVLDDLCHLVNALVQLGADPDDICILGIPYSSRETAAETIRRRFGCEVFLPTVFPFDGSVTEFLGRTYDKSRTKGQYLLILEDGGYTVPLITQLSGCGRIDPQWIKGAVEQTTRGARVDRQLFRNKQLAVPVISIPDCPTKQSVEPLYIAQSIQVNLERILSAIDPEKGTSGIKTLGMYGFGTIGNQVAKSFKKANSTIYVRDPSPDKKYAALVKSRYAELTPERVAECDLVLGMTGSTSIALETLSRLKPGAIIGSTSSRQIEIDMEALQGLAMEARPIGPIEPVALAIPLAREFHIATPGSAKSLTVLFDGYPLNFSGRSLPDPVADAVLSLLLEGVVAIATGSFEPRVYRGNEILSDADIAISLLFREVKPNDGLDPFGGN